MPELPRIRQPRELGERFPLIVTVRERLVLSGSIRAIQSDPISQNEIAVEHVCFSTSVLKHVFDDDAGTADLRSRSFAADAADTVSG